MTLDTAPCDAGPLLLGIAMALGGGLLMLWAVAPPLVLRLTPALLAAAAAALGLGGVLNGVALLVAHAESSVSPVVTVSLGVCSALGDATGSAEVLLREADAQLYIAKSSGRNRCCGQSGLTGS